MLTANTTAPVWLILLFEIKLMLPPLAFCAMEPVELIPVLLPAAVLFAVIVIFPALFVIIEEPRSTTAVAVPDVPVMVMPLAAVIAAELVTAIAEPVVVALKLIAPA